jgi:hypothetical protein
MTNVRLLHHRAGEAGETGDVALQQAAAKLEVAAHALERIGGGVERGGGEHLVRDFRPALRGRDRQRFLAVEVVKERALGQPGGPADVVDRGGGITLRPDHVHGRL